MQGLEELVGLEMVSTDAKVIGTVEGAGLDVSAWRVKAIRVGLRRGTEDLIGRQRRHFMLERALIRTEHLGSISEVVIMELPLHSLREEVLPDGAEVMPAGAFIGMRVMCHDAVFLGFVDNIMIDAEDGWSIPYMQVRLSREARGLLEGLTGAEAPLRMDVRTKAVRALGDMVMLSLTMAQVRSELMRGEDVKCSVKVAE